MSVIQRPAEESSIGRRRAIKETVVIADYDYGDLDIERAIIEKAGFELIPAQCKTEDDVIKIAKDASGIITQYATIGNRAIESLARCRVIARYGSGVDIIDVSAATRKNILVTNVPSAWCVNEVADHSMALLLAIARKIIVYDQATHSGVWHWQSGQPIHRLNQSTLGLLSFGSIAQAIALRASAFGMRVIANDPNKPVSELTKGGVLPVSFEELVEQSDYLVIQAPLTKTTHHLINEEVFKRMKPTAVLINTARGPIVSDLALYRALKEGWISTAGVDDIEEEPAKIRNWKPDNQLFELSNFVVTPHSAYYSEESIAVVREFAAREVVRVLSGQNPLSPVNPDVLAADPFSKNGLLADSQ